MYVFNGTVSESYRHERDPALCYDAFGRLQREIDKSPPTPDDHLYGIQKPRFPSKPNFQYPPSSAIANIKTVSTAVGEGNLRREPYFKYENGRFHLVNDAVNTHRNIPSNNASDNVSNSTRNNAGNNNGLDKSDAPKGADSSPLSFLARLLCCKADN
ncbi:hypothetical protein [Pectobacterium versatile]|uniref:hypothetical protein n=1 Tax=Pectobacterium versatile TaxID=2488639 RepID=UPI001CC93492|nr:hypothetical protein [Pectobacterium versatile]